MPTRVLARSIAGTVSILHWSIAPELIDGLATPLLKWYQMVLQYIPVELQKNRKGKYST